MIQVWHRYNTPFQVSGRARTHKHAHIYTHTYMQRNTVRVRFGRRSCGDVSATAQRDGTCTTSNCTASQKSQSRAPPLGYRVGNRVRALFLTVHLASLHSRLLCSSPGGQRYPSLATAVTMGGGSMPFRICRCLQHTWREDLVFTVNRRDLDCTVKDIHRPFELDRQASLVAARLAVARSVRALEAIISLYSKQLVGINGLLPRTFSTTDMQSRLRGLPLPLRYPWQTLSSTRYAMETPRPRRL